MIQAHRSKKDSVQFRIFPFFGDGGYFGHGFFSTDGVGLFPRRQQRAWGAVGSILAEFSESKKPQGTGLPHSFTALCCFLFGEKLLLRGKVGEILLSPPGCL